jgi:hypothetical protein
VALSSPVHAEILSSLSTVTLYSLTFSLVVIVITTSPVILSAGIVNSVLFSLRLKSFPFSAVSPPIVISILSNSYPSLYSIVPLYS